jgi:hypothetical protein
MLIKPLIKKMRAGQNKLDKIFLSLFFVNEN